jgi:hypothetical protein
MYLEVHNHLVITPSQCERFLGKLEMTKSGIERKKEVVASFATTS